MSGIFTAWADPPVHVKKNYNPNSPMETSEHHQMTIQFMLQFIKILGKNHFS